MRVQVCALAVEAAQHKNRTKKKNIRSLNKVFIFVVDQAQGMGNSNERIHICLECRKAVDFSLNYCCLENVSFCPAVVVMSSSFNVGIILIWWCFFSGSLAQKCGARASIVSRTLSTYMLLARLSLENRTCKRVSLMWPAAWSGSGAQHMFVR